VASIGRAHTTPEAVSYLAQTPQGTTSVIFAPGVISTGHIHSRLAISPDGQKLFWNTVDMKTLSTQILSVKRVSGTWSAPQLPPFAQDGNSQAAVFSPDGKYLFFGGDDGNIYWADRKILDPFRRDSVDRSGWRESIGRGTVLPDATR